MAAQKMNPQVASAIAALEQERQKLRVRLASLKEEQRSLEGEERGLERAIAQLRGDPVQTGPSPPSSPFASGTDHTAVSGARQPRGSVKASVFRLTTQAGDQGITVNELLASAQQEGIELNRGSVSSLMSKMVREKAFSLEGDRYKAKGPFRPTIVEPDAA